MRRLTNPIPPHRASTTGMASPRVGRLGFTLGAISFVIFFLEVPLPADLFDLQATFRAWIENAGRVTPAMFFLDLAVVGTMLGAAAVHRSIAEDGMVRAQSIRQETIEINRSQWPIQPLHSPRRFYDGSVRNALIRCRGLAFGTFGGPASDETERSRQGGRDRRRASV